MRRSSPAPLKEVNVGSRMMQSILTGASPAPRPWRSALVPGDAQNEIKDSESVLCLAITFTCTSVLEIVHFYKSSCVALGFLACCHGLPGLGRSFMIAVQWSPMGGVPGRNSSPSGKIFILIL